MTWVDRNDKPVACPCGKVLASPKSLYQHLRNSHPGLNDKERSDLVGATRRLLAGRVTRTAD